jgi:serine/threonine-protein kinase
MTDDPRLERLLEELLDSGGSPEEVCRECPELLPQVRAGLQQLRRLEQEVSALFPPSDPPGGVPRAPPPAAELPRVDGYEVQGELGRGGVGVVYRARHLRLNRPVALKMLLVGPYARPEERERFLREAQALAALVHPNVVQVHEVGDLGGLPYFTMEFVEGGSLAGKLAGTRLPTREAAALVATLAEAVQAAHDRGIVHRDLKPANVLLTPAGAPKIGDFGLARRLDGGSGATLTGTALGTPSYMAPEQAKGETRAIGPAVDIYALGVILYELLTGRPPFRAETPTETVRQVLSEEPVPPSRLNASVPRDLETICLKCLHKEPHLRYASASALAEDLHHFLRGEAITARPERWWWRLARRVRRRPGFSAAVTAGTLVVVGLAGGGLWLSSDRAAAARALEAERTVTERDAADDLREMVGWLNRSSWPEARAALERARGRLGNRGSLELRRLLDKGSRDLDLATRLEAFREDLAPKVLVLMPDPHEEAFRGAGLGQVGDDPEAVAARVRESSVTKALVDALDYWSSITVNPQCARWALSVARSADRDPDPTGWRARARDPDVRTNPAAFAELINTAPVADQSVPLLLALAKHLNYDSPERIPFLTRIQQAHPGDFWANLRLGEVLDQRGRKAEAIRYFQAAVAIRPQIAPGYEKLGMALSMAGRPEEAVEQLRRAVYIDPTYALSHHFLAGALSRLGRRDEAIEQLRVAIGFNPNVASLHGVLGHFLENTGRYAEALPHYRQAAALAPKDTHGQNRLRAILVRLGRGDEARAAWQRSLETDPSGHDTWCGYAEFCLFLGREDEYRRALQALLAKFGATTDPSVAERAARASLLRPATGDELRQAVALAERAAAVEPSKYPGGYPLFLFARGLAEYRQGRLDRAIASMPGEAAPALGPAPRLVLAMALHRSGRVAEARRTLAAAVLAYDWRANQVTDPYVWMYHVLRREAEGLILPDLPALLDGAYRPRDNDERLALLGVCQFEGRWSTAARLYAEAFEAEPKLAEGRYAQDHYEAARLAALAGSGRGEDETAAGDPERARWRRQARDWLRADLASMKKLLDGNAPGSRQNLQSTLERWAADPDLAGLRDPAGLERLTPAERQECRDLWRDHDALLKHVVDSK